MTTMISDVDADPARAEFDAFFRQVEPRLRPALIASFGADRGREATAEALAWAFENWDRAQDLVNPVSYLYRVGASRTRIRRIRHLPDRAAHREPWVEPEMWAALEALPRRQREAVVLVHGYGWRLQEVADLLDVSAGTISTHLRRGLESLRKALGVEDA